MFAHAHTADRSLEKCETLWGSRESQTGRKFVKGDSFLPFPEGQEHSVLEKIYFSEKMYQFARSAVCAVSTLTLPYGNEPVTKL